jgi:hypothetical protein
LLTSCTPARRPLIRFGNDQFGAAAAVHLGRVDQRQAELDSGLKGGDFGGEPAAVFPHAPGPLAEHGQAVAGGKGECGDRTCHGGASWAAILAQAAAEKERLRPRGGAEPSGLRAEALDRWRRGQGGGEATISVRPNVPFGSSRRQRELGSAAMRRAHAVKPRRRGQKKRLHPKMEPYRIGPKPNPKVGRTSAGGGCTVRRWT